MKVGVLVLLTFTEAQRGPLVGALALVEERESVFDVEIAMVLITTGAFYGRRMSVALQDMTKLS